MVDIEDVLTKAKKLIASKKVIFTKIEKEERKKNQKLLDEFVLEDQERLKYFLGLTKDDFYSEQLDSDGLSILYSFGKRIILINRSSGKEENIAVFMKFKIVQCKDEILIICSFHEAERDMHLMNNNIILKKRS